MKGFRAFVPILIASMLAGCAMNTENQAGEASSVSEIEQVRASTQSDFVKRVLADGIISELEMNEVRLLFRSCVVDAGFEDVTFHDDDTFSVIIPDDVVMPEDLEDEEGDLGAGVTVREVEVTGEEKDPVLECEFTTGYGELAMLHSQMVRNPDSEDPDELIVQCLKNEGVVDSSFTREKLEQVFEHPDTHENITTSSSFTRCIADPLGVGGDEATEPHVQ